MADDGARTDGVIRRALLLEKLDLCLLFLLISVMAAEEEIHFSHWDVCILEPHKTQKSFLFVTVAWIVFLRPPFLATNIFSMCIIEINILPLLCVGHTLNNCFPFSNTAWAWRWEVFWPSSHHSIVWSWFLCRKLRGQLCSLYLSKLVILTAAKPFQ